MSTLGVPGGNSFSALCEKALQRRREEASRILLDEIKRGNVHFVPQDVDPVVEMILRYGRAVEQGTARRNLRALAALIVDLKQRDALHAEEFHRWAGVLSDLTRDELFAVALGYRISIEEPQHDPNEKFWPRFEAEMKAQGIVAGEIAAVSSALARFGLLLPKSAWGGIVYVPSPRLRELGFLAQMEPMGVS
ncbi:hypothetical protein [Rhodovulum sp. MB263]|uniref:hypothetical protein n=1 Tax=Rhodovulum sp. (strain MB263) TaxID=308754 RepID=UPI0009B779E0|nr:hypothetical protein [Rhodovulum sp. MB263]ARC89692.1 hypothetical protein B5V46_14300 [Rhodovulum sp. MB263]